MSEYDDSLRQTTVHAMDLISAALSPFAPMHLPFLVPSTSGEMSTVELIEHHQHQEKFMEATQDVDRLNCAEFERRMTEIRSAQKSDDQHRFDILAMFDQCFSTAQLEQMALDMQWPLEYTALNKATAARAIISACNRAIEDNAEMIQLRATSMDPSWRIRVLGVIELHRQIRDRWLGLVPPVTTATP